MKKLMVFVLSLLIISTSLFIFTNSSKSYSNVEQQEPAEMVAGPVTPNDTVPLLPPDIT